MIKVIFMENFGEYKLGEVRNVAEGYARNFLLRKGLAKVATESEVKAMESQIAKLQKQEDGKIKEAEALSAKLSKVKIKITVEVNEEGHLYGAVTNKDLAHELEKKGFEIDTADIILEAHIKELGDAEATVNVGHGIETKIKFSVVRAAS